MPSISYESEQFPAGSQLNGSGELTVAWDDLLWSALTIGRPSTMDVFRYGESSKYEAIFRLSLIKMALEQRTPNGKRLYRTDAFKQLDPTEKGAINYFIGLIICKLFATKLLDAPWVLHLDVFKNSLNPSLLKGRSRPDLVAQSATTKQWHAFEAKGRASIPGDNEKAKAKSQAIRLTHIGKTRCTYHVGAISYFKNEVLNFYWRDPEPPALRGIEIPEPKEAWKAYYSPIFEIIKSFSVASIAPLGPDIDIPIEELDIKIKVDRQIYEYLIEENWSAAYESARERRSELNIREIRGDGFSISAGPSWSRRREEAI